MKNAIVVDDDKYILKIVSSILRMWKFDVFTASDGDAGWQMIEKIQPDLVISDFSMPGRTGFELFREIKVLFPKIGFILLTGEDKSDIDKLGFDYVVYKPFDLEDLRAKIDEVLALQG